MTVEFWAKVISIRSIVLTRKKSYFRKFVSLSTALPFILRNVPHRLEIVVYDQ